MKQLKLQDQCCDIVQAKRLKELGVPQLGIYTWVWSVLNDNWDLSKHSVETLHLITNVNSKNGFTTDIAAKGFYSAYTVAELGCMIPFEFYLPTKKIRGTWVISYSSLYSGNTRFDTEAQARAAQLIEMIEAGLINVNEL